MNERKEGRNYNYLGSLILFISCIRVYLHLSYRQTEKIIKATGKGLPNHSGYSQISRRVNNLDVDGGVSSSSKLGDDDDVVRAVDSTGIKETSRGQWLRDRWFVKRKGYPKTHVAVNTKTKKILAFEVTDEKVHDGKVLCGLVDRMLKQNNFAVNIKTVLADGAYGSNENFNYLREKGILPKIRARGNSIISPKNNRIRNREVKLQTAHDILKWGKKRGYGKGWMAETAFSSIKRTCGEYVSATSFQNMIKEMMVKISMYNLFREWHKQMEMVFGQLVVQQSIIKAQLWLFTIIIPLYFFNYCT